MRRIARAAWWSALDVFGVNAWRRRRRKGATILCYHNVIAGAPQNDERSLHIDCGVFRRQLEWLSEILTFVPLSDLVRRASDGRSLEGLAALTFDDGYRGTVRNALPVLAELGIPSTLFICSSAADTGRTYWWDWRGIGTRAAEETLRRRLLVECRGDAAAISAMLGYAPTELSGEYLPASWDELRAVSSGLVEFGAHTVTHRNLPALPETELRREVAESVQRVVAELRSSWVALAYPYGSVDEATVRSLRGTDLAAALTLEPNTYRTETDRLAMPRLNIPGAISHPAFRGWVSRVNSG